MNMTQTEYRKHDGVSRTELMTLLDKTPLHFKYEHDHPTENDTPSLLFGRAVHKMILEPDYFDDEFVVAPQVDRRTKEGRDLWNAFIENNKGKDVISDDDYSKIVEMKNAFDANPVARRLLNGGVFETSWFWKDEATGEVCKIRPDCINVLDGVRFIIDYKTTDSCQDGHCERSVKKYGYKFQAGMYREGMFQNTFEDYKFIFIAQEKTAPYAVRIYTCTDEFMNEGYDQFRLAIGTYHACKESGDWYGYSNTTLIEEGE